MGAAVIKTFRVPADLLARLEAHALSRGETLSACVIRLLESGVGAAPAGPGEAYYGDGETYGEGEGEAYE